MHCYINGDIQLNTQPAIAPHDRGLLLGDGVFETIHIVNRQPQFLAQHIARLAQGAALYQIPWHLSVDDVAVILHDLLLMNPMDATEACARITLTRGPAPRGLLPPPIPMPTLLITVEPYHPPADKPWRLWVTPIRRNESSPLSRIKSLSYGDNILAKMDAMRHGADDALFLNTQGYVTGTSMANIFIVKNNVLKTPPVSDGALPGIMRAQIMAASTLPVEEVHITLDECLHADEIFISNALIGRRKSFIS